MKQELLLIASKLRSKADHTGDDGLRILAKELEDLAGTVVTSGETTNNEEDDTGGGNHPKKPGNP